MEIIAAGQWRGGTRCPQRSHRRRAMGGGDSRATPSGNGRGNSRLQQNLRRRAMGGDSRPQWKFSPSCDGKGVFNVKYNVISNNATPGQRTGHPHIIQKWTRATMRHPQRFCRSGDYNAHTRVNACVAKANDQEGSPNKRQRADRRQA